MSDPQSKKPQPDHPQEDDFELEMPLELEAAALNESDEPVAVEPHLDAPALNASTDEFQFSGPVEELDFAEPTDFTFPAEQPASGEASSDSSADFGAGIENLLGTPEAAPQEAEVGGEAAVETVLDFAQPESAEEKPSPKPKRELPAWVRTVEWTGVWLLAVGALVGLYVAIFWIDNADTVTWVLNISCPLLLALIPYALWRSSHRWLTPAVSAKYTLLLALSLAALIGGTWIQGIELSNYKWQFSKTRVAAGKPRQQFVAPTEPPAAGPAGTTSSTK